jgi:hypothetical protein
MHIWVGIIGTCTLVSSRAKVQVFFASLHVVKSHEARLSAHFMFIDKDMFAWGLG